MRRVLDNGDCGRGRITRFCTFGVICVFLLERFPFCLTFSGPLGITILVHSSALALKVLLANVHHLRLENVRRYRGSLWNEGLNMLQGDCTAGRLQRARLTTQTALGVHERHRI